MNKKFKKILIINLCVILAILVVAEIAAFFSYKARYANVINFQSKVADNPEDFIKENTPHYSLPSRFDYERVDNDIKRKVHKSEVPSKKRPVVTIGCSYTQGIGIEKTFAYQLNKITGRTTYNRGVGGSGPQLVYRQLSDENFKNEIPDAEYIIYTFIYNHLNRQFYALHNPLASDTAFSYVYKNGTLKERKRPFWFMYWSFAVKTVLEYKADLEFKNGWFLFYKTMEASVNEMKKKYPNCKFVLMEFPDASFCWDEENAEEHKLTSEQIEQLKSLGIIYLNTTDFVGHTFCEKKYRLADEDHPSELAWEELVPKVVERLKL